MRVVLPPPQPHTALVGVSVGGAAARLSEKSRGGRAEPSPGCSIPSEPPEPPRTEGEPVPRSRVLPGELPAPALGAVLEGHVFWVIFNPSHLCMFPAGKEEEEEKG